MHDVVDVLRGNPGALQRRCDCVAAKICSGYVLKATKQFADRRTRPADDH